MNFNNYTRIQLGLPPASDDAGMAAVRRARVMQMNGFGAMAVSEVTGKPCSAGDYEFNWEGYCDCLYTPGGTNMKYCCGKGNVKSDGSCGKSSVWAGTGFANAPWTVLGKAERWAKVNDPNFNILNPTTWGPAKAFIEGLQAKGNNGYVDTGSTGGGGGTGGGSDTIEEKKDNTMLFVGLGVAAVAVLALSMRK
jgi:hypothetical protein